MNTNDARTNARAIATAAGNDPFAGNGTFADMMEKMSVSSETTYIAEMADEFMSSVSTKIYYMSPAERMAVMSELVHLSGSDGSGAFTMFVASMVVGMEIADKNRMGY